MRYPNPYAWIGASLGLGAPLGALVLRFVMIAPREFYPWLLQEWAQAGGFYVYMTVGSVTAFSLFGYVMGRRNKDLKQLAIRDGLTGIYNHRHLQETLNREVTRAGRYKTPLSCLMIDIDDFKKINDIHGHPFGDHVLVSLAALFQQQVRNIDSVGRYGGEEFMVVMPHAAEQEAYAVAERIRQAVENFDFSLENISTSITISIGLATYPHLPRGVCDKNTFIKQADQALYRAKAAGKNRTILFKDNDESLLRP